MKTKFSKKLSVLFLSMITAFAVFAMALSSLNVKASFDYSSVDKVKSNQYVESLFVYDDANASVTANYTAPSYYGLSNKSNVNGALVEFKTVGATVTLNKTFKVNELKNIIEFIPILNEENFGSNFEIKEFEVTVYEEKTDGGNTVVDKSVTYKFSKSNLANAGTALTVAGSSANGTQKFGSYVCLGTSTWEYFDNDRTVKNELWKKTFLREYFSGKRPFAVVGQTFTGGPKGAESIKIAYEESGSGADKKVYALAKSYDAQVNELYNDDPDTYGLVRQLNVQAVRPTEVESDEVFQNSNYMGLIDNVVFDGFSDNADLKISLKAVDGTGKILVNKVAGEDLSSNIRFDNSVKLYANKEITLPSPKFYLNGSVVTENAPSIEFEIKKVSGNDTLVARKTFGETEKLTFVDQGEYVLTFYANYQGSYYSTDYKLNVISNETFDEDKAKITLTNDFSEYSSYATLKGSNVDVGAKAVTKIYGKSQNLTVNLNVKLNGNDYKNFTNVGESFEFLLADAGEYTFTYTASDAYYTDVLVATLTSADCYHELKVPTDSDWAKGDNELKPLINKYVVTFSDGDFGRNFFNVAEANVNLIFKVKKPNSTEYVDLTTAELDNGYDFTDFGTYEFSYHLTYESKGKTISIPGVNENYEFKVNVVDACNPKLVLSSGSELTGGVETSRTENIITYKAQKGSTVYFGKFNAFDEVGNVNDLTSQIKVDLTYEDVNGVLTKTNVTTQFVNGSYLLSELGNYVFNVTVSDGYNETYVVIKVNSVLRLYYINNEKTLSETYGTNVKISESLFSVLDLNGNEVNGLTKKYAIYYEGELVGEYDELNYNPSKTGAYNVVLLAYENGEVVAQKQYDFTVTDKTSPVITLGGEVSKTGVVGQRIPIASISSTDNFNETKDLLNTVKILDKDGNELNFYNNSFIALVAGTYTVVYTAEDVSGNIATYSYEIVVTDGSDKSDSTILGVQTWIFVLGVVAVVLLIASIVVFIVLNNKKVKVETVEEIVNETTEKNEDMGDE